MKEERKGIPTKLQDLAEKEGFLFAEIEGYDGYYVTTDGRVWGKGKNGFMKQFKTGRIKNYLGVMLYDNGIGKTVRVHILVAKAFLPNPQNKPQVNHKDENPENNTVSNLEWVTAEENCNYGARNYKISKQQLNRKDHSRSVAQIDKAGNILAVFPSLSEAWRQTGVDRSHISSVCDNKPLYKTAGGYKWRWATEKEIKLLERDDLCGG